MQSERIITSARENGRHEGQKIEIGSVWLDYHGTLKVRRSGTVKRAAEKALGRSIDETAEEADELIEEVRLKLDQQTAGLKIDEDAMWMERNLAAFSRYGCNEAIARQMSEYVRAEENYIASHKRLAFVRWLLAMFPSRNADGGIMLTASNADFTAISGYLKESKLTLITPVSGDLLGVYKPDLRFFERLIDVTKVSPERTLFVANSWRNDLQAARLGVNVVIILPPSVTMTPEEINERNGGFIGQVHIVRSLKEARETITRNFVRAR